MNMIDQLVERATSYYVADPEIYGIQTAVVQAANDLIEEGVSCGILMLAAIEQMRATVEGV